MFVMNLKKVFAILLLALIAILMVLPFVGCSSTKKLKNKEAIQTENKKELDSVGTTTSKVEEKKAEDSTKKEVEENQSYEAEVSDGKEVSVKEYDGNGNLKKETVFKGDGKVKTSSGKKETQETKKSEVSSNTDTAVNSVVSKKEAAKTDSKKLDLNLEKKGFSFGDYIFWFVLIITLIVLIYLNNRFKLISIFNRKNNE